MKKFVISMLAVFALASSVNAIDWIEDSDSRSNAPLANILNGINTVQDYTKDLERIRHRYEKVYTPADRARYDNRAMAYACYLRLRDLLEDDVLNEKAQENLKKFIYLAYNKADYDALDEKEFIKALAMNSIMKLNVLHHELYELQMFMQEDFDHPQDDTAPNANNER